MPIWNILLGKTFEKFYRCIKYLNSPAFVLWTVVISFCPSILLSFDSEELEVHGASNTTCLFPTSPERHEMKLPWPSVPPLPLEVYPNPNNSATVGSRKVANEITLTQQEKNLNRAEQNCRLFSPSSLMLYTDRLQRVLQQPGSKKSMLSEQ